MKRIRDAWALLVVSSGVLASLVAQLVKNRLQCGSPGFDPWVGKIPWIRGRLPTLVFWPGELGGLSSPWGRKESDTMERLSQRGSRLWRQGRTGNAN